jgi:hypothetical protein
MLLSIFITTTGFSKKPGGFLLQGFDRLSDGFVSLRLSVYTRIT